MFGFKELLNFLHWSFIRPIKLNISLGGLALGGGLSLAGSLLGADAQRDAARMAARESRLQPIGIDTGYGSVTPLMENGRVTGYESTLSPEYQALRERLLGIGGAGLQDFQTFDPLKAGALFTQQLTDIAAPQEERQRLNLENRLFQQGLLGGTTGSQRMEDLLTAQSIAQQQRNLTGLQLGQDQQQRLFNLALGGVQGASELDKLASTQLGQAMAAGGRAGALGAQGAQFQMQAANNQADMISGFFGQLGQGLTSMAFDSPQVQQPLFSQPIGMGIQESTPLSNPFALDLPRL